MRGCVLLRHLTPILRERFHRTSGISGGKMAKGNARLEAARKAYRDALDVARRSPTPEAWGRLLAAGKELSAAEDPPRSRRGRRPQVRAPIAEPGERVEPLEGLE
jgi:hypothetical protein